MRAVTLDDFDGSTELREIPTPEPGSNELLVRVHASSINGFDAAVASGMLRGMMQYQFPVTLGSDFAGVVERIGSDVGRYAVGDEVFGFLSTAPTLRDGTWAELVVVPEDWSVGAAPRSLDLAEAGALPLAGVAAMMSVDAVAPSSGDVVLVVGATGGVGGYAVQLAARRGATVLATATPDDELRLRGLGAVDTIDYLEEDVAEVVRERYPGGIAGLVDAVSHHDAFAAAAELVARGGRAATTLGTANAEELAARGVTATNVMATPDPELLARLAGHADAGELKVTIQEVYPLERAAEGLEVFGTGKHGKLGISVSPSTR